MATSPTFPQWITCFQKIRPDQYFLREKAPFCDADEGRQETCWNRRGRGLCAEVQRNTNWEIEIVHGKAFLHSRTCLLCRGIIHLPWSFFSTACLNSPSLQKRQKN